MKMNSFCSSIRYRIQSENIKIISLVFARFHDPRAERSEIPSQKYNRELQTGNSYEYLRDAAVNVSLSMPFAWDFR